jgi:hypothetical protein
MAEITYQMVLSTLQTVGLLVGISYYILTLRNAQHTRELALKAQQQALETRQGQLVMGIYNNFASPPYQKAYRIVSRTTWDSFDEFKELVQATEFSTSYTLIGNFFEGVGVLVKEELLDIRFVALLLSSHLRKFWEKTLPFIDEYRIEWNSQRVWSETEFLYNELIKYLEEHPELGI